MRTTELVLAGLAVGVTGAVWLGWGAPWLTPDVHPLALWLAAAWMAWRLHQLDRALAAHRAWTVSPPWAIPPEALGDVPRPAWLPRRLWRQRQRGVLLGKGFRWNAAYTQTLETALAREGALTIQDGSQGGMPALHAVGAAREEAVVVPWAEMRGQVLVTGTTGSGKTRLLEVLASEAIRGEGAVVVMDPKGDRELLARCAAEAQRQGKPFALITPAFPAQSATMNVLGTATTPAEVSARIKALMPSGGARGSDPFFEEYPLALIERLAHVQAALAQPWTLEGLYAVSVLRTHMERLLTDYLVHLGYAGGRGLPQLIHHYRAANVPDLVADALIDDLEKPRDHFTKVTSNLIPAFRGVVGAPLGRLFSPVAPDVTWGRIVDEHMVVYVALASMLIGDIANRIGRVILQGLVGYLGRRYAYEPTASFTPITVLIDEFGDVAYPLFTNALNKGGAAQARFILAQQSLADAEAAMGPAHARRVLDNLGTKIWCRLSDDATAALATEGLGTCTVRLPETGVGLNGLGGSAQRRLAGRETPLLRASWLTALPRGEALVRMKGEVWKLRVPLLTPVPETTLEQLGLTTLWAGLTPQTETI
jgi:conjugal transfer pilus assembly protein TraD